jgi:hypothetical protein
MALTLMPKRPHSSAIALVMWITAALLMQYTPICGSTRSPAIEAMLMMRPPVKLPGAAPLAARQHALADLLRHEEGAARVGAEDEVVVLSASRPGCAAW